MSDALIALAYFSIPLTLILFVRRRRDLPFNWMFLSFGAFIVACGTTHAMEVWTLWNATYWVSGAIKAVTAAASLLTAVALVKIMPDAVALASPEQLRRTNDDLQREIAERLRVEAALELVNRELEERVQARTGELSRTNEQLHVQMEERERAEESLRQSQKMDAVGQLAGGVAHDFNNLLTAILGYADLLASRPAIEGGAREEVAEIRNAGERAATLTRQLLAFSRKQVLEPVVLHVNDLVGDLEKMLRRLIGEDVDLVSILDPSVGNVRADPGQLEQVILNLVVNARDAMPRGGKLTIETANADLDEAYSQRHAAARPGRYVMVAVSDTGFGMDASTVEHIFEPFFTTKEKGKGTGLGLSTVYGIVKQSGGNIWVYSEPGKGTAFKVYLPRVDDAVAEGVSAEASPLPAAAANETILLVEDEESVRTLARRILVGHGYRVLEASGGEAALEAFRAHGARIDLLVTDLVMPDMAGTDLAARLNERHPDLRVLFMSGYTGDAAVRSGQLVQGRAFLQKPFTPAVLLRRVRDSLV
ncbi:MAG TPA: ATP-binding protein [Thermoanaerobaculia bacterium]